MNTTTRLLVLWQSASTTAELVCSVLHKAGLCAVDAAGAEHQTTPQLQQWRQVLQCRTFLFVTFHPGFGCPMKKKCVSYYVQKSLTVECDENKCRTSLNFLVCFF